MQRRCGDAEMWKGDEEMRRRGETSLPEDVSSGRRLYWKTSILEDVSTGRHLFRKTSLFPRDRKDYAPVSLAASFRIVTDLYGSLRISIRSCFLIVPLSISQFSDTPTKLIKLRLEILLAVVTVPVNHRMASMRTENPS
jgi:hypothetical protein